MHSFEEYKGHILIKLQRYNGDNYPFSFGLGKAKLIIENLDAIKEFVASSEQEEKRQ